MGYKLVSSFSERLKDALKNSQANILAESIGLSKQAISMYVTGKRTPKRPTVEAIARELNVNPLWLLGYDVPMYIEQPATVSDSGLWKEICQDERKLRLAQWIAGLDQAGLDRMEKLLDLVEMLPKE